MLHAPADHRRRLRRVAAVFAAVLSVAVLVPMQPAAPEADNADHAVRPAPPKSLRTPWLTILCRFKDRPEVPPPVSYFETLMTATGAGQGGMYDYFKDQSYGRASLAGSRVVGWYAMPYADADSVRYPWEKAPFTARAHAYEDCIRAAIDSRDGRGLDLPRYYGLALMFAAGPALHNDTSGTRMDVDYFGDRRTYGVAEIGGQSWRQLSVLAQEMLHGYGVEHSRSDTPSMAGGTTYPYTEYGDPWDVMSCNNCDLGPETSGRGRHDSPLAGLRAPIPLNIGFKEQLNWVPGSRIHTIDLCDVYAAGPLTLELAGADAPPGTQAPLLIKVEDGEQYYSLEFRRPTRWGSGGPVLVREVRANGRTYVISGQVRTDYSVSIWRNDRLQVTSLTSVDTPDRVVPPTVQVRLERPPASMYNANCPVPIVSH